jgi:hypothetical protein
MILATLIAASLASARPSIGYAEARSAAYRDCIAAERSRGAGASAAEIGRGKCARPRSRLLSDVREHLGFGWIAAAKSDGQAKRMRLALRANAEEAVARFEGEVQAWLAANGGGHATR